MNDKEQARRITDALFIKVQEAQVLKAHIDKRITQTATSIVMFFGILFFAQFLMAPSCYG